jgi:hypothetical protein
MVEDTTRSAEKLD